MENFSAELAKVEERRIASAYAKRQDDARYSWFSPAHLFIVHDRERQVLALLRERGLAALDTKDILEIGCGTGYWIREFIKWGALPAKISGVDLLSDRVSKAKELSPEGVTIQCGNAATLGFPDNTFDLVLQSTVFTSVLDFDMKLQMATEMIRVVKRTGLILWYDYHINNPWNTDVRGVNKQEIHQLFPGCRIHLKRITLAPPVVRWLVRSSWLLCEILAKVPWLCTHYLGVIQK